MAFTPRSTPDMHDALTTTTSNTSTCSRRSPQTAQPAVPSWMVGPGGLPNVPPSVGRLYELQYQYMERVSRTQV